MKDIAPTIEEIKDVKEMFERLSYQELVKQGLFKDNRKMILKLPMTYVLMSYADDSNKEKLWKYCKKIAVYVHTPVTYKEYKRMLPFADDKDIIDVILKGLVDNIYPFSVDDKLAPIEGYYYAIATISQSSYRRDNIIDLLQMIADYLKNNKPDALFVLQRNIEVLKNDYPDLNRIEI